jgi:predicted DNA-binding transcriptional regulator AlpA
MPALAIDGTQKSPRIIGLEEVKARTRYSKSKIYRLMLKGQFPQKAKKLAGSRSTGWLEDEIDAHIEALRPEPIEASVEGQPVHIPVAKVISKPSKRDSMVSASLGVTASKGTTVANPKWIDTSLISIGNDREGSEMFLHMPSRQLLVVVGTASPELLRRLG